MSNNYVLAMYDVRGKQKFIYRSEHLKEIIGGSAIIRDVFKDYLYPAAIEVRNQVLGSHDGEAILDYDPKRPEDKFSFDQFEKRMGENQYLGEVVYNGGGNFLVLFRSADICRQVTAAFTRKILEEIGTLKVICTYISDIYPDNYAADRKRLYDQHRLTEAQETSVDPYGTLPIVQVDRKTSMPLTHYCRTVDGQPKEKVTKEAWRKYCKYKEEQNRQQSADKDEQVIPNEKVLDRLVSEKGRESLLAVIYIDGNNMGDKISRHTAGNASYDAYVNSMRDFSRKIQKVFIDGRMAGIDEEIRRHVRHKDNVVRLVVGAGDEITIITNARAALPVAQRYLQELAKDSTLPGMSSCAGISIFHSHTPFADAYTIAEECCEHAKKVMKEQQWENACLLDYHFNQGAIGVSLDDIRDVEETAEIARPWIVDMQHTDPKVMAAIPYERVDAIAQLLRRYGRGNAKGLLQAARESKGALYMEVQRIEAHMDRIKYQELQDSHLQHYLYVTDQQGQLGNEIRDDARDLIIRILPVFDIWFREESK